jgi:hypothetical protein
MSILLWIMVAWFAIDLLVVCVWAGARKRLTFTPAIAFAHVLTYGFFITVLVLAATKGVTP